MMLPLRNLNRLNVITVIHRFAPLFARIVSEGVASVCCTSAIQIQVVSTFTLQRNCEVI